MTGRGALVSCVMVTRDRPGFVAQAARYFARCREHGAELVIVVAGETLLPEITDARVRVVRIDAATGLGTARNLGAEAATGDILMHWDDDDWIGPRRLTRTLAAFDQSHVMAAGLSSFVRYEVRRGDAWRYVPLADDAPFVAGATLAYRREAWRAHPFPDRSLGEDSAFVAALDPGAVTLLPDDGWYVAIGHGANTAPVNLADPRWREVAMAEVTDRLGEDLHFYAAMRRHANDRRSAPPEAATGARPRAAPTSAGSTVTVVGDLLVYDGLGSMTEYAVRSLSRAGVEVRVEPIALDRRGLSAEALDALDRPPADGPLLYWSWPRPELAARAGHGELFVRTAWESTELPTGWASLLDGARAVLVPSAFVADACRASDVTAPIVVVPDGVDPDVYRYVERPVAGGVTTLVVGTLIDRKRIPEAIAAWKRAFAGDADARLVIKARFRAGRLPIDDPRIDLVDRDEPTRGIGHWYEQADVLLALGNEGFGLPVVEAMATGLPVVALDSEGQHDVCRESGGLVLAVPPARREPFVDPRYGRCGSVAVPDLDVAAGHLRWVAAHRDEARDLGRAGSAWARRHRDVWTMGASVLDVIEASTVPRRRLRRPRAMWVPSWPGPCGVSEYTAELARALPGISISAAGPNAASLRLLHVQHEDALFDDSDLARFLERVDVPIAITEHSVGEQARPWEQYAHTLIAMTDAGADRLRASAEGRSVARLHHGCPTWFPPRKRERGRTIGAFGFLAPYKGFFSLLAALRQLPGSELELYSHPRQASVADEFAAAALGLPVRWHREYLDVEDVARRLAATCDVLVFWYDEVPIAAASGAVRVALATGVPVLTSPTTWFADLASVTYQPEHLVEGLERLLTDTDLRDDLVARARDFCSDHAWSRLAAAHIDLWESLEAA